MAESSARLVRSFSNPSPTSSEEQKVNPLQRALTTSISFGRFMSETLDWEKWSAFTQNRHLEEVEKYSKPGSVAEKKAYFEAHFKRRRAAALLEQQNATADNFPVTNLKEEEVQSSEVVVPVDSSAERTSEEVKPKGIKQVMHPLVLVEESTNNLENDGCFSDIVSMIEDKVCKKDDTSSISIALTEKKPQVSSEWASPVKAIKPVQLKNSEKTPQSKSKSKSKTMDSSNKRRTYTTSLHMSIELGAIQEDASKALPKVENSKITRAPAKKYKNSAFPPASTRASANGLFKHNSDENNRITRPLGGSTSRARTVDEKFVPPSSNDSKSSNLSGIKTRTSTVPSSFMLKSEERALKRREKLEQKMKSKEAEKRQMHAKPQTKARRADKDLRNSIALETTKNAEISPRNLTKKVPTCLPKIEEKPVFKSVQENYTRPPWRLSAKTEKSNDLNGKNSRASSHSSKRSTNKRVNENASPNIQL